MEQHPRVSIHIFHLTTPTLDLPMLQDRTLDLAIVRSLWENRTSVRWPTLKAPTLLLLADSGDAKRTDAKRRAETEALAKAAKVQSVWFSPGHHDLHLEFPERVADILDGAVRDGFFA